MTEDDIVQPVDGYVSQLLEYAKKQGVEVDTTKPTRGQRLEAALYFDSCNHRHTAMEIMIGKRINAQDPERGELFFMTLSREYQNTPESIRSFYDGFSHRYFPE